jgi:DNA-binding transcriptional regulator YiaG
MGRTSELTPEQIKAIRESTEPQKVLADKYGVTQAYVSYIRRGERLQRIVIK